MARPISMDLRERLVLAVARDGISARAAAARFGVSVSSAIVWVRRHRETGSVAPGKIGGYKPNVLAGEHGDWLVARAKSDFTLRGLVAELAERGLKVDYVQVWRFVHARGLSFKKKRSSRRAAPPQDRPAARAVAQVSGTACSPASRLHRRDLGQDEHGPVAWLGTQRSAVARQGALRSLAHHDLHRRAAP